MGTIAKTLWGTILGVCTILPALWLAYENGRSQSAARIAELKAATDAAMQELSTCSRRLSATQKSSNAASTGVAAGWVVQVASWVNDEKASQFASELRSDGLPAFVQTTYINERAYFSVRVGPYSDRNDAERVAGEILAETGRRSLVKIYP